MDAINDLAERFQLTVIEDAAQAIGAEYPAKDGRVRQAGTMSAAGCFQLLSLKESWRGRGRRHDRLRR